MAILIQKTFRGYYSRKYKQDFYARKRWLNSITFTAKNLTTQLQNHYEEQVVADAREKENLAAAQFDQLSDKLSYLLSTSSCPGVLVSPFGKEFDATAGNIPIEEHIKSKRKVFSTKAQKMQVFSAAPQAINKPLIAKHPKQTTII